MILFLIFAGITIVGLIGYGLQIFAVRSHLYRPPLTSGKGIPFPRPFHLSLSSNPSRASMIIYLTTLQVSARRTILNTKSYSPFRTIMTQHIR